jgi:hypothetical protein
MSFLPSNIARNIVHANLRQAVEEYGAETDLVMLGQKPSNIQAENIFNPGQELREAQAENTQNFIKSSLERIARLSMITAMDDDELKYSSAHQEMASIAL